MNECTQFHKRVVRQPDGEPADLGMTLNREATTLSFTRTMIQTRKMSKFLIRRVLGFFDRSHFVASSIIPGNNNVIVVKDNEEKNPSRGPINGIAMAARTNGKKNVDQFFFFLTKKENIQERKRVILDQNLIRLCG